VGRAKAQTEKEGEGRSIPHECAHKNFARRGLEGKGGWEGGMKEVAALLLTCSSGVAD